MEKLARQIKRKSGTSSWSQTAKRHKRHKRETPVRKEHVKHFALVEESLRRKPVAECKFNKTTAKLLGSKVPSSAHGRASLPVYPTWTSVWLFAFGGPCWDLWRWSDFEKDQPSMEFYHEGSSEPSKPRNLHLLSASRKPARVCSYSVFC